MGLVIYCLRCRRDVAASRVAHREKGDRAHRWVNRCNNCGLTYAAADPGAPDRRQESRRAERERAQREAAGQLGLFGGKR